MINYYHILGVSKKASQLEIKAAYRKLALRYHPDKNQDNTYAEERFKEINHAYQVLSNPQQKANHDLILSYQDLQAQLGHTTRQSSTTENQASRPADRYGSRQPGRRTPPNFRPTSPISKRQNIIATVWAFGIFTIIVILGLGLKSYNSYQHEQYIAQQKELVTSIYHEAEQLFQEGKYPQSLQVLNTINHQQDIHLYRNTTPLKQKILQKLEEKGSYLFEESRYAEAAKYYQLLVDNQPYYTPFNYARLVSSYEMVPDFPGAIKAYQQVIKAEPSTIEARTRLAALFLKQQAYEKALNYFQEASTLVIQEYKNYYGAGYALAMDPTRAPDSHYQLHCGLGQTYTALGMYKQAESAFKWAIFLRPDDPEAYFLRGENFSKDQQPKAACQAWSKAQLQGSRRAETQLKEQCR